jgi:hypothetical protein
MTGSLKDAAWHAGSADSKSCNGSSRLQLLNIEPIVNNMPMVVKPDSSPVAPFVGSAK